MKTFILLIFMSLAAFAETYQDIYTTSPDVENCQAGVLTASEKKKVLDLVNSIRALHKLPAVTYNENGNNDAMQAALICDANQALNHFPDQSAKCYTASGANGAKTSNLSLAYGSSPNSPLSPSSDQIIGWLMDDHDGAAIKRVGHRRAIINPGLKSIAFGRVDGVIQGSTWTAGALKYQDYVTGSIPSTVDYVAYPQGDYPTSYFNKAFYLSFHVFYNKSSALSNTNVDFSQAQITVKNGNQNLTVSGIVYDVEGWGSIPNSLQWYVAGLKDGVDYTVNITNAKVNNVSKDYTYTFKLVAGTPTGPGSLTQTAPVNNSIDIVNGSKLTWNTATNATSYNVQIATDMPFTKIVLDTNVTKTELTLKDLDNSTKYYWRVAPKNSTDIGAWSSVWSFTTKAGVPVEIKLTSPGDQELLSTTDVTMMWNKDAAATNYHLQVANSTLFDSFSMKFEKKDISTNSYIFSNNFLSPDYTYYWRVRGTNSVGDGAWSKTIEFTTGKLSSIDLKEKAGIELKIQNNEVTFINLDSQAKFFNLKVFDILGSLVTSQNIILESSMNLKLPELKSGSYFLNLQNENLNFVKQLQILK